MPSLKMSAKCWFHCSVSSVEARKLVKPLVNQGEPILLSVHSLDNATFESVGSVMVMQVFESVGSIKIRQVFESVSPSWWFQ